MFLQIVNAFMFFGGFAATGYAAHVNNVSLAILGAMSVYTSLTNNK